MLKKTKILIVIIVIVLLFGSVVTAYVFNPTVKNTINLLTKSPKNYYTQLELNSLNNSVDKAVTIMNASKGKTTSATNYIAKLSWDKNSLNHILQNSVGINFNDLENNLGIPLDSIGLNLTSANDNDSIYQNIDLTLNNKNLITGNFFIDLIAKELLLSFPELSPAYLTQPLELTDHNKQSINLDKISNIFKKLTPDRTGDFIKRYGNIILEQTKNVELSKKENLTVNNVTVDANLITVRLYPKDLENMCLKILETSENDDYIIDLLPLFNITKETYQSNFNSLVLGVKNTFKEFPQDEELLILEIYVGKKGEILSRNIKLINDGSIIQTFSFVNLEKDNKTHYLYQVKDNEENDISITGSHVKEDGAYTGSLVITSEDVTDIADFTLDYEEVKIVPNNDKINIIGKFNLSSLSMMGMEIELNCNYKENIQLIDVILKMGKSPLVTLETTTKSLDDFVVPKPNEKAEKYIATTEIDKYVSTIKLEEYISRLSDSFGIDLLNLINSYLKKLIVFFQKYD